MEKNQFFDINKLPGEKGLLIFGLSMNKLSNRQNAENCFKDIQYISPRMVSKPNIGLNFIYSDFLYLYSNKSAPELKNSFMHSTINHKNSFQKILEKNSLEFQIQHAFNYLVWNQLYVGTKDFSNLFNRVKEIYSKDKKFQKYLEEDCKLFEREMEENQINFFLEEFLMMQLLMKNQVKLPNEYIENQQKWVLFCYPGRPLKSFVYFSQLNPFDLVWEDNPYQNSHYDLEGKKLINMDNIDLDTYSVL